MLVKISEARFRASFRLRRQVTGQGPQSIEARDSSDRVVMVHFLGPVLSPETQKRLADMAALPPERLTGLEGAFQVGDEAVLVTGFMPHVRSFDDWFAAVAGERRLADETDRHATPGFTYDGPTLLTSTLEKASALTRGPDGAVPSPQPTGASDAEREPGDFTRMFGPIKAGSEDPAEREPPAEAVTSFDESDAREPPPVSPEKSTTPEPPGTEPGEFTRAFGALAEEPPKPTEQPEHRSGATPGPVSPNQANPALNGSGGGFTEVFGPAEGARGGPDQSQTTAEEPSTPTPPIRPAPSPKAEGAGGPRPAKPRIVWRDRSREETPPEPSQPQVRVRWKGADEAEPPAGSVPREPAPASQAGPEPGPAPPRSPSTRSEGPESRTPATPPPQPPPGQFTQIFGQELSPGSASAGPGSRALDERASPSDDEFPPHYTGPRESMGKQVAPLPDRKSSDYLRALGGDTDVETPRAAPAPDLPPIQQEQYSPDLPPPIAGAPPPPPAPSDYTRMMGGRAVQPKEAPAPPPAPAVSPKPEISEAADAQTPTWLWVALATIGIVAVLLVVLVILT